MNMAREIQSPWEESFTSSDGLKIFFRFWEPRIRPHATVVINHGVNSHSGQYGWAGEQLAAAGLAVYAIDMRGRGRSEGRRFRIDEIAEYTGDLDRLITIARERNPNVPLFLLGHSAGGVVASSYALDHQDKLDGLICESFAFRVPAPNLALQLIKLISRVLPGLPVLKLKNKDFTRDPQVVAALNNDPLTRGEVQPAATVAALLTANQLLEAGFARIKLPVLIMHGTADKATLPGGSEQFQRSAGSADKTLKLYEGYFHDLLNDIGKEAVLADIVDWIEARTSQAFAQKDVA